MLFAVVIYIMIVFILLILVTLFLLGVFRRPERVTNQYVQELLEEISLQQGFCINGNCGGIAVTGERGRCQLYPTFSKVTSVVDNIQPIMNVNDVPLQFQCLDGFSIPLVKYQRTCHAQQCLGLDGKLYNRGEIEYYYSDCSDWKPCDQSRSAVVFNFGTTLRGKLDTDSICMLTTENAFTAGSCPSQVTLDNNLFMNVDKKPLDKAGTMMTYRIRKPGTFDCIIANDDGLTVSPCLGSRYAGHTWLLTPPLSSNNRTYPPQLLSLPDDVEKLFPKDKDLKPEDIIPILSRFPSLRAAEGSLYLGEYMECNSVEDCPYRTQVVSSYAWNMLH